ncbi:DUF6449 domain-containing protein [Sediminibacillus massiliensis]|uniref:DUF6449 domain-containing protein n=1 Tax=Sediminibacillus massiliensis TaxID=1926277 RepID=UPI00098835DD|nr:DUF6449 domain-containing protein [Sediminibacillus massiliensis]
MPSKTSSFKKEIIKSDLLNVGWIGFIYLAGLLFALPINIMMLLSNESSLTYDSLFGSLGEFQMMFIFVIPVLLAVFLFRYMQTKKASDFMHSLPISRESLYNHHVFTGIALLIIPVFLTALVLIVMHLTTGASDYYELTQVWEWAYAVIVLSLIMFFSAVFVGVFTGISSIHAVLTYLLLLFPAGIIVLIYSNIDFLLYGFPGRYFYDVNSQRFSPITDNIEVYNFKFDWTEGIVYLVISFALYLFGMFLYKKRPAEATSQALVFPRMRPVFKYGVSFCAMLFGGFYFGEMQSQFTWIIFGYVLGSLLGYVMAEMLLQKTWKVFGHWKGYLVFAAVTTIILLLFVFDITGYENRIPETEEIAGVYYTDNPYFQETDNMLEKNLLTSKENIEAVKAFHKQLLDRPRNRLDSNQESGESIFIGYRLENGDFQAREYFVEDKVEYENQLKSLYESDEYKQNNNPLFEISTENVERIQLYSHVVYEKGLSIADPEQMSVLIDNLKKDISQESFMDMAHPVGSLSYIMLEMEDGNEIEVPLRWTYTNFIDSLKEFEIYKQGIIQPEDISKIVVLEIENTDEHPYGDAYTRFYDGELTGDDVMTIENQEQIAEILKSTGTKNIGPYLIGFYFNGIPHPDIYSFAKGKVPQFVTEHFQQ